MALSKPLRKPPATLKIVRRFDPKVDSWLQDHCPTYGVPTMPFTVMISVMMETARSLLPHLKIVGLEKIEVTNWLSFEKSEKEIQIEAEVMAEQTDQTVVKVSLSQYREARLKELSRFEPFCSGFIFLGDTYPPSQATPSFSDLEGKQRISGKDFYGRERIFSGPSLQLIDEIISVAPGKAVSFLRPIAETDPRSGLRVPFLLDAATQAIAQIQFEELSGKNLPLPAGAAHAILKAVFHSGYPCAARVRCDVSHVGFQGNERFPSFDIRIWEEESPKARLWAEFRFVAILFPMGRLMERIPEGHRKAFFLEKKPFLGSGISNFLGPHETWVTVQDIKNSDWLPGSVASVYLDSPEEWNQYRSLPLQEAREWLTRQVVAKDLVAREWNIHPAKVQLQSDASDHLMAFSDHYPLNCCKLSYIRERSSVRAIGEGKVLPDEARIDQLRGYWRSHLNNQIASPIEVLWMAVFSRFWKKHHEAEPKQIKALHGKPCIYLANHQTYVEAFIAVAGLSALSGCSVVSLAKQEHRKLWLGYLTDLFSKYPGNDLPIFSEYVNRDNPQEVLNIVERLESLLTQKQKSILVHVEGTRARAAHHRIEKLSSIWGDLAIRTGCPIVPIRFLGGLPLEDKGKKYDFPFGYGGQSYFLGPPIGPEALQNRPFAERARLIRDAINSLGTPEDEMPSPPNEAFAKRVQAYSAETGADEARAVVFQCLTTSGYAPSLPLQSGVHRFESLTQALIAAGELAVKLRQPTALVLPETPEGAWVRELATWLYGPRGPIVCSTAENIPGNAVIQVFGGN